MLDVGADPNSDHYGWINSQDGPRIKDLVKDAAFYGHESVCKTLLNSGVEIYISQRWNIVKVTIFTGEEGRIPIIKLLVEPFRDTPDFEERTENMLGYAAGRGYVEVVRWLLEIGTRMKPCEAWDNALMRASREGHLESVRLLLSSYEGELLEIQEDVLQALYKAADAHSPAVCELLRGHLDTARIIAKRRPKSRRIPR